MVKQTIAEWKENYKKGKCCAMCGFKRYPYILHFHHIISRPRIQHTSKKWKRDKRKPKLNIFQIKDLEKIKREVKKCVLLCPNCHAMHHRKGINRIYVHQPR